MEVVREDVADYRDDLISNDKMMITCENFKIEDDFKRYMDDGSTLLPNSVDKDIFLSCLNNLHPSIVFTLEPASIIKKNGKIIQILNFLDLTIMLHDEPFSFLMASSKTN